MSVSSPSISMIVEKIIISKEYIIIYFKEIFSIILSLIEDLIPNIEQISPINLNLLFLNLIFEKK